MKRLLSILLFSGLMCSAQTSLPLVNGGFENGLAGWTTDELGMTLFLPEAAYRGNTGIRIKDLSNKWGNELQSHPLPAKPGMVYEISFMARSGELPDNDGIGVYLVCYDQKDQILTRYRGPLGEICTFFKPRPTWQKISMFGETPPGTASIAVRFHTRSNAFALLDIDEVSLSEHTPAHAASLTRNILKAKRHIDKESLKMQVPFQTVAQKMNTIAIANHPRLFASAPQFQSLAHLANENDGIHRRMMDRLEFVADAILKSKPLERKMEGRRLLGVSRNALFRISTLALCYRIRGREQYRERCVAEMRAVANFSDWNPSHFLDVGEMALALATGYDWLYDTLSEEDRELCANALLHKALLARKPRDWWRTTNNNWGQVCHTGMIAAAVAIAERDPETTHQVVHEGIQNLAIPMRVYEPHGNYPEGPGYWEYGTGFNVLGLAILQQAFGTTFGLAELPGFQQTANYFDYVTAPSGRTFSYSDCGPGPRSKIGIPWWFAHYFEQPELVERQERKILEQRCAERTPLVPHRNNGWFHAYTFFWLMEPEEVSLPQLPLVWNAEGPVPIVIMRSSWDDGKATFVGLKAGSPSANHGHMDAGSFVLETQRVRWFHDLGAEPYHRLESMGVGLWDGRQEGERWKLFRLNNFGHNTLVIDGQLQRVAGHATVNSVTEEGSTKTAVLDLTPVYSNVCSKAIRTVKLLEDGQVVIIDELEGLTPGVEVLWGACTFEKATLEAAQRQATLTRGTAVLTVKAEAGQWRLVDASQPPFRGDSKNPNLKRLELLNRAPESGKLVIQVTMTPNAHE